MSLSLRVLYGADPVRWNSSQTPAADRRLDVIGDATSAVRDSKEQSCDPWPEFTSSPSSDRYNSRIQFTTTQPTSSV